MINRGDQEGLSAKPFPGPFAHTCVDNPREVCPACVDAEEFPNIKSLVFSTPLDAQKAAALVSYAVRGTPITDFDLEQSRR